MVPYSDFTNYSANNICAAGSSNLSCNTFHEEKKSGNGERTMLKHEYCYDYDEESSTGECGVSKRFGFRGYAC